MKKITNRWLAMLMIMVMLFSLVMQGVPVAFAEDNVADLTAKAEAAGLAAREAQAAADTVAVIAADPNADDTAKAAAKDAADAAAKAAVDAGTAADTAAQTATAAAQAAAEARKAVEDAQKVGEDAQKLNGSSESSRLGDSVGAASIDSDNQGLNYLKLSLTHILGRGDYEGGYYAFPMDLTIGKEYTMCFEVKNAFDPYIPLLFPITYKEVNVCSGSQKINVADLKSYYAGYNSANIERGEMKFTALKGKNTLTLTANGKYLLSPLSSSCSYDYQGIVTYKVTYDGLGVWSSVYDHDFGTWSESNRFREVEEGSKVVFGISQLRPNTRVKAWKNNGHVVAGNITNTYTLENLSADANVTVEFEAIPPIRGVKVSPTAKTLYPRGTVDVVATIDKEKEIADTVIWECKYLQITVVDGHVVVLAGAVPGSYNITATSTTDPTKFATCCITVPQDYGVSYSGNENTGGNAPGDDKYYLGDPVTVKGPDASFTKTGHRFIGWKAFIPQAEMGTAEVAEFNAKKTYLPGDTFKMPSKIITLEAVWEKNDYSVVFYDGSTKLDSLCTTKHYDEFVTLPGNGAVKKEDYTLGGWSLTSGGAAVANPLAMEAKNVSLFAVWTPNFNKALVLDPADNSVNIEKNKVLSMIFNGSVNPYLEFREGGAESPIVTGLTLSICNADGSVFASFDLPPPKPPILGGTGPQKPQRIDLIPVINPQGSVGYMDDNKIVLDPGMDFVPGASYYVLVPGMEIKSNGIKAESYFEQPYSDGFPGFSKKATLMEQDWNFTIAQAIGPAPGPTSPVERDHADRAVEVTAIVPEKAPLGAPIIISAPPTTPAPVSVESFEDAIPLGVPVLPKTGEVPASLFYGIGGVLTAMGAFMKRK